MSQRFPNYTNTPPNGWRYIVPETNQAIGTYMSWAQLYSNIQRHYEASGYKMPEDMLRKVEAFICSKEPEYCGEVIDNPGGPQTFMESVKHTFHAAYQCMATLVSNRAGSGERPSQELANYRAAVCAVCKENDVIHPCNHCSMKTLNVLIEKLAGSGKTPSDAQLKFCKVCHCNLKAKIWTKHEAIWNHTSDSIKEKLPATCWLKTEAT